MPVPVGQFVYQKKNVQRQGADICEKKCKKTACAIQACIANLPQGYGSVMDTSKCDYLMARWNKCCEWAKREAGVEDNTPST